MVEQKLDINLIKGLGNANPGEAAPKTKGNQPEQKLPISARCDGRYPQCIDTKGSPCEGDCIYSQALRRGSLIGF